MSKVMAELSRKNVEIVGLKAEITRLLSTLEACRAELAKAEAKVGHLEHQAKARDLHIERIKAKCARIADAENKLKMRIRQLEAACILGDAAVDVAQRGIIKENETLIPYLEMKSRAEAAEAALAEAKHIAHLHALRLDQWEDRANYFTGAINPDDFFKVFTSMRAENAALTERVKELESGFVPTDYRALLTKNAALLTKMEKMEGVVAAALNIRDAKIERAKFRGPNDFRDNIIRKHEREFDAALAALSTHSPSQPVKVAKDEYCRDLTHTWCPPTCRKCGKLTPPVKVAECDLLGDGESYGCPPAEKLTGTGDKP